MPSGSHKHQLLTRTLCVMCIMLMASVSHAKSEPKNPSAQDEMMQTTHRGVWLVERMGEPKASLIRKLERGSLVSIISRVDPWVRVMVNDGTGDGGYVLKHFLRPASKSAARTGAKRLANPSDAHSLEGAIAEKSGYRQATVDKVWMVSDPERLKDSLLLKLRKGETIKVLAAGETWLHAQTTDGTGRHGYVMTRWTVPATYRAVRAAVALSRTPRKINTTPTPSSKPLAKGAKGPARSLAVTPVKTPSKKQQVDTDEPTTPVSATRRPSAPKASDTKPVVRKKLKLKLAGVGLSSTSEKPAVSADKTDTNASADSDSKGGFKLEHGLIVLFVLSLGGLIIAMTRRRKPSEPEPDQMLTLGKIDLGEESSLTLVKVPGKLLVVARTPQAIDVVDHIEGDDISSSEAGKILESAARRQGRPRNPRGKDSVATLAARSTPAVVRHRGPSLSTLQREPDPFQSRLNAARNRLRSVMGA